MNGLLVLTSSYAGFAALALAMDGYQRQVWRRRLSAGARSMLQAIGVLGLALSLWACVAELGWALGLVSWLAVATFSSLGLTLTLTYLPRRIGVFAGVAWLLAGAARLAAW